MEALAAGPVESFAPLSLGELNARAELQQRIDRKYVVPLAALDDLLAALGGSYGVLEIDGARLSTYRTTYLDTPSLLTYRAHMQRRRRRFKCRSRHYVESGLSLFEVKLKGTRGQTVKERLASKPGLQGAFDERTQAFLRECLWNHYRVELGEQLCPTLHMRYRRITLASLGEAERLTIDVDLRFAGANGAVSAMAPEYAIVESKSANGRTAADRRFRALGFRQTQCSKYCLGIALTRPDVHANEFLWLARRYFRTAPPAEPTQSSSRC